MDPAKNGNSYSSPLPPDAMELLNDPRLEGLTERPAGQSPAARELRPAELIRSPSSYLSLGRGYGAEPGRNARWVNEPERFFLSHGRGLGFDHVVERPLFEDPSKPPKRLFHLWERGGFFIASPDMLELLSEACPGSIACIPIDYVFSDGQALDGYVFLDVIQLHYAYDYKRSVVYVEAKDGRRFPRLGHDRAMREDIPSDAQLFREAFYRHEVFVSRTLADRIARLASRELSFSDVHTHHSVEFPPARGKQSLKACLKQAQVPQDEESMPLQRRISIRVIPLLHDGRFAEAESVLTDWLRARPVTPYHVVADLQITTSPQACAEFFDEFCVRARYEAEVKTVYSEMNGFTINPDLWFCDAFAFAFEGNEDGDDWLGDFHSSTDDKLIITGLEPLQEVFANQMQSGPVANEQYEARDLAAALVIIKFQRLLQSSLPFMGVMKWPLWATAHDHYEYLVKLLRDA